MIWKTGLLWLLFVCLHLGSLQLPHRQYSLLSTVNFGLQFLIFLICIQMSRCDVRQFRPAVINVAILFGSSVLLYLSIFIGKSLWTGDPYASIYYHQYVNKIGYNILIAGTVIYLIVDYLVQKWRVVSKYALTTGLLIVLAAPFYYPYVLNPLELYRTEEYSRFLQLKRAQDSFLQERGRKPTVTELVDEMIVSKEVYAAGESEVKVAQARAEQTRLASYLDGNNGLILFWKPLNLSTAFINGILVLSIGILYIFKFRYDRPHAAYLEKIIYLFFFYCALHVLQCWAFTLNPDANLYYAIHDGGQYLTIVVLLGFVLICSLRLRFILSPFGRYYEQQIATEPERISRWRDEIDQLILKSFFQKTPFIGRLGTLEPTEHHTNKP
jgi:hypothetical protein